MRQVKSKYIRAFDPLVGYEHEQPWKDPGFTAYPPLGSFQKCAQSLKQEVMKVTRPGVDTDDGLPTSTEYNTYLHVPNYMHQLVNPTTSLHVRLTHMKSA